MSDTPKNDVGDNSSQGGAKAQGEKSNSKELDSTVYDQLMSEIKGLKSKLKAQNDELDVFKKAKDDAEMKKKLAADKHLEVIEMQKKQIEDFQNKLNAANSERMDMVKLSEAVGLLQQQGMQLESQYYGLLPLDEIEVSENGEINKNSLAEVVESFAQTHPRLVAKADKLLPSQEPKGNGKIGIEEFQKLSQKEQITAMNEGRVDYTVS